MQKSALTIVTRNLKWTFLRFVAMLLLRSKSNSRTTRSQVSYRIVLSRQTKEWTWVNCKLITASH